jgi:hypothetical protein
MHARTHARAHAIFTRTHAHTHARTHAGTHAQPPHKPARALARAHETSAPLHADLPLRLRLSPTWCHAAQCPPTAGIDATAAWYCALPGAFPELQVCGQCSTLPVFPDWRGSFVRAAARTSGRRKRGRTCRTTRTCAACASAWSTYSAASACRSVGPTPHEGKCGRPHATPRHPPTDRCVWRLWLKSGHQ